MKRVLTIQDISCLGKCSLTVALPVISAFGVETCVLPTAVLSTHTQFQNFTFCDLTEELPKIKEHYLQEGFSFDALYTGYLGSFRQLDLVSDYFDAYRARGSLIVVDPVMADHGVFYRGFTKEFATRMARLCAGADVILPNLTEAAFLLDVPYVGEGYDEAYIKSLLQKLVGLGCKKAVLTGVSLQKGKIGAMGLCAATGEYFSYYNRRIDAAYHGTGDIFASAFVGGRMRGYSDTQAIAVAADFTARCIEVTKNDPQAVNYGVEFEYVLPELLQRLAREDAR